MSGTMQLERLYQEVGALIGIGGLRPDAQGCCRLVFDTTLLVEIRHAPAARQLVLSCALGADVRGDQALLVLRANAWGAGSAGGWFAVDERHQAMLQAALPLDGLEPTMLLAAVEKLLDAVETWRARLRQAAVAQPPRMADLMQRI